MVWLGVRDGVGSSLGEGGDLFDQGSDFTFDLLAKLNSKYNPNMFK